MTAPQARRGRPAARGLVVAGLVAGTVTAVLFVAGRLHQPDYAFSMFGADPFRPKSLLASIALGLAGVQVLLALWLYRRLPLAPSPPAVVPTLHRVGGVVLFALTVPIAVHCLVAYGVQFTSARVAIHSVAGCFFYGAFAAKVLLVRSRRLPGWALPTAGGTLAVILGVLWCSSALWYYNGLQLPHF
jgi:Family of unknown function (DUF6529)